MTDKGKVGTSPVWCCSLLGMRPRWRRVVIFDDDTLDFIKLRRMLNSSTCFLIYCAYEMEKQQSTQRLERHLYTFLLISAILSVGLPLASKPEYYRFLVDAIFRGSSSFLFILFGLSRISGALYNWCRHRLISSSRRATLHNCKTKRWTIAALYIVGPFFPDAPLSLLFFVHSILGAVAIVEFVIFINDKLNEVK